MNLDDMSTGRIVPLAELNERLIHVLGLPLRHPLAATPIAELVIRSARNMLNCTTRISSSSSPLNSSGLYAAVAVLKILGVDALPLNFESMMGMLHEHFPLDTRFFNLIGSSSKTVESNDVHASSTMLCKRRSSSSPYCCYRVGQIFQHVQQKYWAVIYGWDPTSTTSNVWQLHIGIANLRRGATQPFYQALAQDSSRRYVAEENIDTTALDTIETDAERRRIIEQLCNAEGIGHYFQRIDLDQRRFLPTQDLLDEYVDDFV
jgi:hemimethylated DNA binding protein